MIRTSAKFAVLRRPRSHYPREDEAIFEYVGGHEGEEQCGWRIFGMESQEIVSVGVEGTEWEMEREIKCPDSHSRASAVCGFRR